MLVLVSELLHAFTIVLSLLLVLQLRKLMTHILDSHHERLLELEEKERARQMKKEEYLRRLK